MKKIDKGQHAVNFINNLTLTGDYSNHKFVLRPWQEDIIRKIFGTLNKDGTRQYRNVYVEIGRKNGKTNLVSSLLLYYLIGLGKSGQEIYSCASTRKQASIVFQAAAQMIAQDKYLSEILIVTESTKRIAYPRMNSFYESLSSEASAQFGKNPSLCIFDELMTQPNKKLWAAMTSGSGSRLEPLTISITTAGDDKSSLCYEIYQYGCRVRDGIIEDKTFLPIIYEIDEDDDWKDEKNWYKANPAMADFLSIEYLREKFKVALELPSEEKNFKQLFLNRWTEKTITWLNMTAWDKCNFLFPDLERKCCYLGVDLSTTTDISAVVCVFPPDGDSDKYQVLPFFFIPQDNIQARCKKDRVPYDDWVKKGFIKSTEGSVVDYNFIRRYINELGANYNIASIAIDPWNSTQLAIDLINDGFEVEHFQQNAKRLSAPSKELERLILSQKINHGANPVLRWMASNVCIKTDEKQNICPVKNLSRERIDGILGLIMGIEFCINKDTESQYETSDLMFF